jgi:hypothetical protein
MALVLVLSATPAANAWISQNSTNKAGEDFFSVSTYNVPKIGPTDNLKPSTLTAKVFTVGCTGRIFEIVFLELQFQTNDFLYMGKATTAQISIDNAKSFSLKVKEKPVGNVITVADPKSLYKKLAKSKQVKITYKVGGQPWIGIFKTAGLSTHSSSFSRYGCNL